MEKYILAHDTGANGSKAALFKIHWEGWQSFARGYQSSRNCKPSPSQKKRNYAG